MTDLVPAEMIGSGQGVFQCATGVAALVAGIWAGLAWGGDGRWPLLVAGAVTAVLAIVMLVAGRVLDAPGARPTRTPGSA